MDDDVQSRKSVKMHIPDSVLNRRASENPSLAISCSQSVVSDRGAWGGQLEFILTCIGFSVGLGNVWRFPYLVFQYGGGAFLIPYVIMLCFLGMPLYCMELCFGQFASLGPLSVWKICPIMKGLGVSALTVQSYILVYFNVIISWCLYFLFSSFFDPLPWEFCRNAWNTENCIDTSMNKTLSAESTSPSEEFFYRYILDKSDGIHDLGWPKWELVLLLWMSWLIIFIVLLKGIESLGKASYVISIFPYILLTAMLIRGCMLPGAKEGIIYYLQPNWDKILEYETWVQAATQIFFSTGVCMGALVAMSSFSKFKNNCVRDAINIPIINCCTSVYAGFVVFSILGYMAHMKGVAVRDVATDGPGLVFIVYPEGLASMPLKQLWAVLFFLMMTLIGYSSQFSSGEAIIGSIMDEYPETLRVGDRPMVFRAVFCLIGFLLGLPMVTRGGFYIFTLINSYGANYPLLITGLLECTAISWVYGCNKFCEDIALMIGRHPPFFFKICWKFISPTLILVVLICQFIDENPIIKLFDGKYIFPPSAYKLAWTFACIPLFFIVFVGISVYCRKGGFRVLQSSMQPSGKWGPSLENRDGKYLVNDLIQTTSITGFNGMTYMNDFKDTNTSIKYSARNVSSSSFASSVPTIAAVSDVK